MAQGETGYPRVGVIIVNYNGGSMLLECLASLEQQDYPAFTTIVVDNGSSDGSLEAALEEFPRLHAARSRENLGFAEGNNLGFHEALRMGCAFVALINNDAAAERTWLRELVSAAEAEEAGICGGKILTWGSNLVEYAGEVFDPVTTAGGYTDQPDDGRFDRCHAAAYACGASMLIRSTVLHHIGGFDPDFFAYHEDVDLCLRAWLAGFKVVYVPAAIVRHRRGQTGGGRIRDFYGHRNALATVLKCYQWSTIAARAGDLAGHYWSAEGGRYRRALAAGLARLPATLVKRRRVQRLRRRGDAEVLEEIRRGLDSRPDDRIILAQERSREVTGEIHGGRPVIQEFIAPAGGLCRIDPFLATYARRVSGTIQLRLFAADGPLAGEVLRTASVDAALVRDNAYQPFVFDPLPDSGGRRLQLELAAPEADPGNALTVWYHPGARLPGGKLAAGGRPLSGALRFRAFADGDPEARR